MLISSFLQSFTGEPGQDVPCELNNTFHLKGSMVSFGFGEGNSEVYGEK